LLTLSVYLSGPPDLYYWRTAGGLEVDLVAELEDRTIPIEVKATRRIRAEDCRHLEAFIAHHEKRTPFGILLYAGDSVQTPAPRIAAIPLAAVL
jgi:predicted AAA+ superfamily ATPase